MSIEQQENQLLRKTNTKTKTMTMTNKPIPVDQKDKINKYLKATK